MSFKSLKAHASRNALLTLAIVAIIPAGAMAQPKSPVFTPAAGWEVNSGQLSNIRGLGAVKLPCVISTEYDNGYVVRFSGGGQQMMALAIDFRQDVFKQGRQYDAMISIGSGYVKQVKATAFTHSTLIFNLRPLSDFYNAAQNGGEMELDIDGNVLKFSLGRIGAVYPQLESCYNGGPATPVKPLTTQTASKAPVASVESEPVDVAEVSAPKPLLPEDVAAKPLPRSFDDIVKNADAPAAERMTPLPPVAAVPRAPTAAPIESAALPVAPKPVAPRTNVVSRAELDAAPRPAAIARTAAPVAPPVAAPVPVSAPTPITPAPVAVVAAPKAAAPTVWEAKAGDDLKIVLSRWAERAGYDLQWQSDMDGKVAQDIKLTGSFEDAVSQIMAENSAATGIGAHVETAQGGKRDIGPRVSRAVNDPAPQPPAVQASIPAEHAEWVAAPGANIQSILDQWSTKAGVAVVWQSYMSVPVKHPLKVSGTYEQAVQSLLDQYMNDPRRPIGQLNVDPGTGAKTLLMDIAG